MTAPAPGSDDARREAAALAFALLRFESAAAHPNRASTPPGCPRIGEDALLFVPSWRPVPNADVVAFLAGLPSPALLSPTTTRGVVSLLLVEELTGDRATWGRKTLSNQRAGLEQIVAQLGLPDDARILLEFDDETHVLPLAVLRVWAERFAVQVGWSIGPLEGDARADARLMLYRSDGGSSWGGVCPVRPAT